MFHHSPTHTIRHVVVYGYIQRLYILYVINCVRYSTLDTVHLNPRTVLHVGGPLLLLPITCQHGYDYYAKYTDKKKTNFPHIHTYIHMYKDIQKGAVTKSSLYMTNGLLIYD
jgi:hypothetical protein